MNREELDYIIQEGEKLLILGNAPGNATQETTQETILRLIREAPSITQKEMASRIGLTPDGVKFHMNRLKDQERLKLMGAVLAVAAKECQIVIFTCVPERYAFIGEAAVVPL